MRPTPTYTASFSTNELTLTASITGITNAHDSFAITLERDDGTVLQTHTSQLSFKPNPMKSVHIHVTHRSWTPHRHREKSEIRPVVSFLECFLHIFWITDPRQMPARSAPLNPPTIPENFPQSRFSILSFFQTFCTDFRSQPSNKKMLPRLLIP